VVLLTTGGGLGEHASPGHGSYTASGPWRIRIDGTVYSHGCTVTLKETTSGTPFDLPGNLYDIARYQIPRAGRFTWTTTDRQCLVTPLPGMGKVALPFTQETFGDTDLFPAPPNGLDVRIVDNHGGYCTLRLFKSNGDELDTFEWMPGVSKQHTFDTSGATSMLYMFDDDCTIQLSARP
jgi:hypothetical protein